ncbi:MAG TPA: TIGR02270 family protein [Luteitalea sp.]|nr:TIGR02270 family protein [Luteitalea sp.]
MPRSLIVAQYADELAFLWTVRRRAVRSHKYTLASLAALDERLEAHRDGLRLAGDDGWTACQQNLDNAAGGELFALTLLAFESGDRQRMSQAVTAAAVSEDAREGLVAGLAWLGPDLVRPWILRLADATDPWQRATGIMAAAARGDDPGASLAHGLAASEAPVRAAALRAAGLLKRLDLLSHVQRSVDDEDEVCRFAAAWALTLLAPRAGLRHLTRWVGTDDDRGRLALETCFRAMHLEEGREWIRTMAQDPEWRRRAVNAVGVLGDPTSLPWLIVQMETPPLARVAGEAFTAITGIDIDEHGLDAGLTVSGEVAFDSGDESEAGGDDAVDHRDADLVTPSAEKVAEWWRQHQQEFPGGTRHLAGRSVDVTALGEVLRRERQPLRAAAALQLALLEPEAPYFDIGARATFQRQLLTAGR